MKFLYKNISGVTEKQIIAVSKKMSEYIRHMKTVAGKKDFTDKESSVQCVSDSKTVRSVQELIKEKVSKKLKYIIVIGIGGSNLGTKAIYSALRGPSHLLAYETFPKMIFVDTVSNEQLTQLKIFFSKHIHQPEEILICSISKSGNTTETIANTEFVLSFLKKYSTLSDRCVVITDMDSEFAQSAEQRGLAVLTVPNVVGGRYSVFSAVGLFPLAAAGLNISGLIEGAKKMRAECTSSVISKNPAALSAAILYTQYKKSRKVHDSFMFAPELESLGKWYRQLQAESLGKEKNIHGKTVRTGILPTTSIGSTDLHSIGQLYLSGSKNIFTSFVYSADALAAQKGLQIPKQRMFPDLVHMIFNKTAPQILYAILSGTKIAYTKKHLPFCEIILGKIDETSIGKFLQFRMIETMYLGHLLQINAFDQHNVEDYKKETRKILEA